MPTGLERIAEKSRSEPNLQFTSLAHHVTGELIWESLNHIPVKSARGVDGLTVGETSSSFRHWSTEMLKAIHRCNYRAPAVRRVHIPKPGKAEKRPIGIPTVADRALQRSVATVLSAVYEQDFLSNSFGGRPRVGAHNALCTFNQIVMTKKTNWVLECDLKNFFGSLDHGWLLRFVQHRVGDPRILKLIKSWLRAGVLENGAVESSEKGTPQGGSISVLLSNIYLHYVLDVWFTRIVQPRLRGSAQLVRYLDDFVICFEFESDARRVLEVLPHRLAKFSLALEPTKTKLAEFGRFAIERCSEKNKPLETVYFLGFTHYCTLSRQGKFMLGRRTEKSRHKRFIVKMNRLVKGIRHQSLAEQTMKINQTLQGHYAYYGMGGNFRSLKVALRQTEKLWRRALSIRSQRGNVTWEKFQKIRDAYPLRQPRLYIPFERMPSLVVL
jgi:group II intron reverse transcriptase/maturase